MTLEEAKKKIRNAWLAGLISGFLTLLFTVMAMTHEGGTLDIEGISLSAWSLLDVFLILLFTFGIFMKSRVAAVGMFIYFLISKVMAWAVLMKFDISVLIGILFLYFFFEGARGAIVYHRLRQSEFPASPSINSPGDG